MRRCESSFSDWPCQALSPFSSKYDFPYTSFSKSSHQVFTPLARMVCLSHDRAYRLSCSPRTIIQQWRSFQLCGHQYLLSEALATQHVLRVSNASFPTASSVMMLLKFRLRHLPHLPAPKQTVSQLQNAKSSVTARNMRHQALSRTHQLHRGLSSLA